MQNARPPLSSEAIVHTVCKVEHPDSVSIGILPIKFHCNHPRDWTNHDLNTFHKAIKVYIVKVTAKSHF
jgi:hypothetical protein